jgi:hypothetical protein
MAGKGAARRRPGRGGGATPGGLAEPDSAGPYEAARETNRCTPLTATPPRPGRDETRTRPLPCRLTGCSLPRRPPTLQRTPWSSRPTTSTARVSSGAFTNQWLLKPASRLSGALPESRECVFFDLPHAFGPSAGDGAGDGDGDRGAMPTSATVAVTVNRWLSGDAVERGLPGRTVPGTRTRPCRCTCSQRRRAGRRVRAEAFLAEARRGARNEDHEPFVCAQPSDLVNVPTTSIRLPEIAMPPIA